MTYYAVRKGKTPGIYTDWPEAQKQISGFSGAQYKKFNTRAEAEIFMSNDLLLAKRGNDYTQAEITELAKDFPITVFTDGGAIGNDNLDTEHSAAWAYSIQETGGKILTHPDAPAGFEKGASNNVMEVTALINALKELINTGFNQKPILFGIDSEYTINGAINLTEYKLSNWKNSQGKTIENVELWEDVDELLKQVPTYKFVKIHSHDGDMGRNFFTRGNDLVDRSLGKLTGHNA